MWIEFTLWVNGLSSNPRRTIRVCKHTDTPHKRLSRRGLATWTHTHTHTLWNNAQVPLRRTHREKKGEMRCVWQTTPQTAKKRNTSHSQRSLKNNLPFAHIVKACCLLGWFLYPQYFFMFSPHAAQQVATASAHPCWFYMFALARWMHPIPLFRQPKPPRANALFFLYIYSCFASVFERPTALYEDGDDTSRLRVPRCSVGNICCVLRVMRRRAMSFY